MAGIYIIENNINGMVYVGRSVTPFWRFREHKYLLKRNRHTNRLLQGDYNKYGENAFTFMVIKECPDQECAILETQYIQYYRENNIAPIYNDAPRKNDDLASPEMKRKLDYFRRLGLETDEEKIKLILAEGLPEKE